MDNNLKANLSKFLEKKFDPINKRMLEQEKERHKQFLKQHFEKYDVLAQRHSSYIYQLITLEGGILAAIIVFTNSQQITIWFTIAVFLILLSLAFGIWRQHLSIQASYQIHQQDYCWGLESHWWTRELWKDETVKKEKEIIEPNLKKSEIDYKNTLSYKVLKLFRLNADRVENVFVISFVFALFFLILHLLFKVPILLSLLTSS